MADLPEEELYIGKPVRLIYRCTNADHREETPFISRIVTITAHTFGVALPYSEGNAILLPVGAKLEVFLPGTAGEYVFTTEIIDRDFSTVKSYILLKPNAISRVADRALPRSCRVVAITSGKGGVGKTVFTINLGIALAKHRKRVFIIDADLGTANIDVLLRLNAPYNLSHVFSGQKSLLEVAVPAPGNIAVIPGGSGFQELTKLNNSQFARIIASFNQFDGFADIILIDTGSGISSDVSNFIQAADEVLVLTTTEPHAITDAYALIKVMSGLRCPAKPMLVVNRAESLEEAKAVASKLQTVAERYLDQKIGFIGWLREDKFVSRSIKEQQPVLLAYPQTLFSGNVAQIAARLLGIETAPAPNGITRFVNRLYSLLTASRS